MRQSEFGCKFLPATPERRPMAEANQGAHYSADHEAARNLRAVSGILLVMLAVVVATLGPRQARVTSSGTGAATPSSVELSVSHGVRQAADLVSRHERVVAEHALLEVDPELIDTSAEAALETHVSGAGVSSTAPLGFSQTSEAIALDQAIAAFEAHDYVLGFALVDVGTGRGLSYNADEPRYPASSIKAAFCTMVYEQNGPVSEGLVAPCIIESSNEAYHALSREYGQQAFADWLAPMAPEAAENAAEHLYPWISPREFLVVWQEVYRYGTSGEPGAAELTGYLSQTSTSAWGELLRDEWEVWDKAGWYPTTTERATCDCGVIFSDCGPYVVVVMSDAPEDFEALKPVLDAINVAHGKMCGGSTESHL